MQLESISELVVLDLGVGMAPALTANLLRSMGAEIIRIEVDGGDPFYDVYPAYSAWHSESEKASSARLDELVKQADICLLGGETHPAILRSMAASDLTAVNDRLVVLDFGGAVNVEAPPAVDLLAQARSGLCFEQYSDRPIAFAFPAPTYGAVLLGLIEIFVALLKREESGQGAVATTSLDTGALLWFLSDWMSVETPDTKMTQHIPKDARQLIFRCRGGRSVHVVMGVPGAVAKLCAIVDMEWDGDPNDIGQGRPERGARNYFFPNVDEVARRIENIDHDVFLAALKKAGISAESVEEPGVAWDDEQTSVNGILVTSPQRGRHVGSPIGVRVGEREADSATRTETSRLRIIDLSAFVAGPFASKLLADVGVDVIKVDPPKGDPQRVQPHFFASVNRGKRSIGIDAKRPEGLEIIRKLCATADAVHQNFRTGVAERLGVDPASLRIDSPTLVTLEAPGYGLKGPKARTSAFDMAIQALCGLEYCVAGEGNRPISYRSPVIDYAGGALGAVALLMGLYERKRFDRPVAFEVSLFNAGIFLMSDMVQHADGRFVGAPVLNSMQTGSHPAECLYRTRDGWIAVAARTSEMAETMAECLGLGGQLGARDEWGELAGKKIAEAVGELSTHEVLDRFADTGVWAERCVEDGWGQLREDKSNTDAGRVLRFEDDEFGRSSCVGSLTTGAFNGKSTSLATSIKGPRLGEHTVDLMTELGYSSNDIQRYYDEGIIF